MILQALVEYYEALAHRGEIAKLGWYSQRVHFALNLSPTGELLNVVPLSEAEERGKKIVEIPKVLIVPLGVIKAGKVVKSNFLCENTGYFLGFDSKGNPERAIEYFEACKSLHLTLLNGCNGPAAQAVQSFFEKWEPTTAKEHPALQPYIDKMATANLVFMIDGGDYAHDDLEICKVWDRHTSKDSDAITMRCLVTGEVAPVAILHSKIKGIPGAQSIGASLFSFNERAYESYGRNNTQGLNAPVGKYAAFAYVTALNHLLASRENKQQIGNTAIVYWAEQGDPVPPKIYSIFFPRDESGDNVLSGIMEKLALGKPIDDIDMNSKFYILALSPNAARVSVRFFLQNSFGAILENLRQHYLRLEIDKPSYDHRQYLSISSLLYETINPNSRDKASSPLMSGAVMRSVLMGERYPVALYQAVLGRIRAERRVTRGRAAIIKAYMLRNQNEKEVSTVALNENSNNRAYVLGRLFAVLENAQLDALPGINTTIKDRFFTSACATPGSVFPQLLKLSTHHTAKAKYGYAREADKAKLIDKLDVENNPLPSHHSLNEQGIFILGYYHQTQARYNKKEDKDNGSNN